MKSLLFLLGVAAVLATSTPQDAGAYDKVTDTCMNMCVFEYNPNECKGERSYPACTHCVRVRSRAIELCMRDICKLTPAEARHESYISPDLVCGRR